MNNLPKVVTQQRRGRASNPRLLDRKSDALPLTHRATFGLFVTFFNLFVFHLQVDVVSPLLLNASLLLVLTTDYSD